MKVLTKHEFYRKFLAGDFGNRADQWMTVDAFEAGGYAGPVGIRSLRPGGLCLYHVPAAAVRATVAARWPDGQYNISPMMPDEHILIQGELARTPDWDLYYSHVQKPMRVALAEDPRRAAGLRARLILRHFLDADSYADLELLLERYPDAAIEFSTYAVHVGVIPGRNTIIWEVRNY